ncbi:MAG: hypothetical protein IPK32_07425 [Verrucomicrobiaceae bacterium]|nr:hypothetical protein [Verrucomicrobiaceae bacterium]
MKKLLFTALSLLLLSHHALAQSAPGQTPQGQGGQQQEETTRDGLWDGRLKGGNYIVRAQSIIALSKHEYIANAAARVVEVNITLSSSQIVRFYFFEPVKVETGSNFVAAGTQAIERAKGLVEQAAGRVSPTLTEAKVVKDYPNTTHSHTVEFAIKEEARLNSLFQSLERSFRTGVGRIWKE